ncbi:MAG: TonB family protein [Deltaproteobacteria bacterium]|nr:TonB family protein [Deltaproteobacteria bacterium]
MLTRAVLFSLTAQAAGFLAYEFTRPAPIPKLSVRLVGDGQGQILVTKLGDNAPLLRCTNIDPTLEDLGYIDASTDPAVAEVVEFVVEAARNGKKRQRCEVELAEGTRVRVTAVLGREATFGGYHQLPMRTPEELVPYLGDPLAKCTGGDVMEAAAAGNVLDCSFTIKATTELAAEFGEIPDNAQLALPTPQTVPVDPKAAPPKIPVAPIDAEKLDEKPLTVAIAPPQKVLPPPQVKPPPPPPPPADAKKPPPTPPPNMVMVEVKDDKNVKDKAPDDATKLSDKNRDVEKEQRAKETNLEKEQDGKQVATKESDDKTSKDVGGPDKDKIRQTEDSDPTTDKRVKETDHSGKDETAKGAIKGDGGKDGQEGTGEKKPDNLLGMRGIEGRGRITEQGNGRKQGKRGTPGINTPLSSNDYERIIGKEKVDDERQVAARKMSAKKGRWERKLDAVKSALENFVPDVQVGNQTALKTRAHPFALYIARMHRRIHELWGFGFLEQLDEKPANYPLNNPELWTNLEVSVNQDGTVHKVTIAKTSGSTEFDVAAVDTVLSAAPFETTPEAIRSVNGKIYLRWGFYRNWRQCGTFNVEPYILTSVPSDDGMQTDSDLVKNTAKLPGKKRPIGDKTVTPDDGKSNTKVNPSSSVKDQQAVFAANLWVSAFATASVDKLVKYSTVPFYAGGKIAAQTAADLKEMFSGLVVESGPMKDWKLLSPNEYSGGGALPEGNVVLQIRTAKESFAIVMTRTKSGEYRATQLAR